MSEEREPVRLRDDDATAGDLRAMLDAARGEHADAAMLDRVLAGLLAGGGGGGGSGGTAATAKIASAVTIASIGIAVTLWAWPSAPTPSRVVAPTPTDARVTLDAAAPADAAAASIDAGTDPVVIARPARQAPPPSTTSAETDQDLMLRVARERDPTRSLELALEHRARFASSPLAEDREARIVLDLAALHRSSDATAAADAFRARWPRSAHLPHIDAALARMGP